MTAPVCRGRIATAVVLMLLPVAACGVQEGGSGGDVTASETIPASPLPSTSVAPDPAGHGDH
jgi:hypothetical protein